MKPNNFNEPCEEKTFFIAKINKETLWGTDAPSIKKCLANLCRKLNIKSKTQLPKGSALEIVQVTVSQTSVEEFN